MRSPPYCQCRIVSLVRGACVPDVVVLQCGADTLVGDPMDSFSLSAQAVGECVQQVLGWDLPTLILGGGGPQAFTNLSRLCNNSNAWTTPLYKGH